MRSMLSQQIGMIELLAGLVSSPVAWPKSISSSAVALTSIKFGLIKIRASSAKSEILNLTI